MEEAIDYDRFAHLYDTLVRFEEDVPFFRSVFAGSPGPVLELMAGTGRVSVPLAESGVPLTCVDRSASMLAVLRSKLADRGLACGLVRADVRSLPFADDSFDAALLPFQSLSELVTEESRRRGLRSIRRVLAPGGRFVCTLNNPGAWLRRMIPGTAGFREIARHPRPDAPGEVALRLRADFDRETHVVTGEQVIEEIGPDGRTSTEIRVPLRFILPGRSEFETMASEEGYGIESLAGDYRGAPFDAASSPYLIWTLRKRPV